MSGRLALLLCVAACADPAPEEPVVSESSGTETPTETGTVVEPPAEPLFLAAETRAESAELAEAALRTMVREKVLGVWGREAPIELLGPGAIETSTIDGEARAFVGLSEAAVRALVERLPERLPQVSFTGPFAEAVAPLQEAAIASFVCERRRELFGDECELADLEDGVRLAADALRPLRLVPVWSGGVPVNAGGEPLRKPAVRVLLGDEAATGLAGLPIVVVPAGDGEPLRVSADGEGLALVNADPGEGLVATLDRAALVPPLDAIFPELRAPLRSRRASLHRWALVGGPDDGPFAEALGRVLRERGAERPLALENGRALKATSGSRRAATLRALANANGGALDVVLVAQVDSHFASRMGSRRTWYEARAEVQAYLAWTGEVLGTFEAQGNGNGIGDARAEAAARAKVARDVARQLVAAPALGLSRDATAARTLGDAIVATR